LKTSRFYMLAVSLVVVLTAGLASAGSAGAVTTNKVLLYGPSTFGGAASIEAQQAAALGLGVDVADAATWSSMTAAQFAQYRAIVIPDNHDSGDPADLAAAEANAGVWGPAVNGNVIASGADPEYHGDFDGGGGSDPGAVSYINRALAFAAGTPIQTGAYIALDGYYSNPGSETPAKVLDGFGAGAFGMNNTGSDDIHIDPAVTGPTQLSDSILSNWGETTHSYFSRYSSTFRVWAIGLSPAGPYTTSDGQKGFQDFIVRPAGPTCTVPKVKGKSKKKAKKKIRASNCTIKVKGHGKKVKKQKPKPGTLLPQGSTVKVTVH
jgi:PASTA domain